MTFRTFEFLPLRLDIFSVWKKIFVEIKVQSFVIEENLRDDDQYHHFLVDIYLNLSSKIGTLCIVIPSWEDLPRISSNCWHKYFAYFSNPPVGKLWCKATHIKKTKIIVIWYTIPVCKTQNGSQLCLSFGQFTLDPTIYFLICDLSLHVSKRTQYPNRFWFFKVTRCRQINT